MTNTVKCSLLFALLASVYSETLTFSNSNPPSGSILQCQDPTTPCIINCNDVNICKFKELHSHPTSQLSFTVNFNTNTAAQYSKIHTYESSTIYINGNGIDCADSLIVYAHYRTGAQLFIETTFFSSLSNAIIYAPIGYKSILSMKCGDNSCISVDIYDDWSTTVRLESTAIYAFQNTQIWNIFDSGVLSIARTDYNTADMDYRGNVYLLDCTAQFEPFKSFQYYGLNHADWIIRASGTNSFSNAYIEANTDDRIDESSVYNVKIYGTASGNLRSAQLYFGASADVFIELKGSEGLMYTKIYAKPSNSLTVWCHEDAECLLSDIECPSINAVNSCNWICEDGANCQYEGSYANNNNIYTPAPHEYSCDNIYLSPRIYAHYYCAYDQTVDSCKYESQSDITVIHECSSACTQCAFDNVIAPNSIVTEITDICSNDVITFTSNPTTSEPTFNPTSNPTLTPTLNPSTNPTLNPFKNPTLDLTLSPITSQPSTNEPTSNPATSNPTTMNPTLDTLLPTSHPSFGPSISNPALHPITSNTSTINPTKRPTLQSLTVSHPTQRPTLNEQDGKVGYETTDTHKQSDTVDDDTLENTDTSAFDIYTVAIAAGVGIGGIICFLCIFFGVRWFREKYSKNVLELEAYATNDGPPGVNNVNIGVNSVPPQDINGNMPFQPGSLVILGGIDGDDGDEGDNGDNIPEGGISFSSTVNSRHGLIEKTTDGFGQLTSISDEDKTLRKNTVIQNILEVQKWLHTEVGLPQYLDAFVKNGYESLSIIKEITDIEELEAIGIESEEHRVRLFQTLSCIGSGMAVRDRNMTKGDDNDGKKELHQRKDSFDNMFVGDDNSDEKNKQKNEIHNFVTPKREHKQPKKSDDNYWEAYKTAGKAKDK